MRLSGLLLLLLSFGASLIQAAEHTQDSTDQVKQALANGQAVLLDVRERSEWDQGHLRDARLLPLSFLQAGLKSDEVGRALPQGKIVYCHCASGWRCLTAADLLRKLGYDVRPLRPGYQDLLRAGFAPAAK